MNESHHMGTDGKQRTAEDVANELGATMWAHVKAVMEAADHVAGDFLLVHRIQFLAQAIRREHPTISEARCDQLAALWTKVAG